MSYYLRKQNIYRLFLYHSNYLDKGLDMHICVDILPMLTISRLITSGSI